MDDANPYESPKGPTEPRAPRRTRWRLVPSSLLIVFGGVLVLGSVSSLALVALVNVSSGGVSPSESFFGHLFMMLAGLVWIASGVAIWRRMWWRGALGVVGGYVLGAIGANLAFFPQ